MILTNVPGLTSVTLPSSIGVAVPGYGHDLSCVVDLDPAMLEADGITCLSQAMLRRVTTPRGTLLEDANYGYDLTQHVNDDLALTDLARIAANVDSEFLKDERIFRSSTTITFAFGVLTVASSVTPSNGPTFRLVLAVSALTATILQVST